MLAKLHTAYYLSSEYNVTSAHKLDDFIIPIFLWFDLLFTLSLYKIYGTPVSIYDNKIFPHKSFASTFFIYFPYFT